MQLVIHESGPRTAETILFLHGMGASSWMWQAQLGDLSQDYHCLAVDLPGNGESYQVAWLSLADTAVQLTSIIQQKAR